MVVQAELEKLKYLFNICGFNETFGWDEIYKPILAHIKSGGSRAIHTLLSEGRRIRVEELTEKAGLNVPEVTDAAGLDEYIRIGSKGFNVEKTVKIKPTEYLELPFRTVVYPYTEVILEESAHIDRVTFAAPDERIYIGEHACIRQVELDSATFVGNRSIITRSNIDYATYIGACGEIEDATLKACIVADGHSLKRTTIHGSATNTLFGSGAHVVQGSSVGISDFSEAGGPLHKFTYIAAGATARGFIDRGHVVLETGVTSLDSLFN